MYTSRLYMGSNITCRLTDFQSLCIRLDYIWTQTQLVDWLTFNRYVYGSTIYVIKHNLYIDWLPTVMYTSPLYMGSNTTCRLTDFQSLCIRLDYIWDQTQLVDWLTSNRYVYVSTIYGIKHNLYIDWLPTVMYTSPLYMASNTTCRLTDFQSLCIRLDYIWHQTQLVDWLTSNRYVYVSTIYGIKHNL